MFGNVCCGDPGRSSGRGPGRPDTDKLPLPASEPGRPIWPAAWRPGQRRTPPAPATAHAAVAPAWLPRTRSGAGRGTAAPPSPGGQITSLPGNHSRTLPADSKPFAMSRSGGGGGGFQLFLFLRVTETVTRRPVVALSPVLRPWPPEDATLPSLLRARHGAWRWQPSLCCGPGPSGAAGGGGRINIE